MKVSNLILQKLIGKGVFGEVYLSNYEGKNELYATKIYDRIKIENSADLTRYFNNEIRFLHDLNHPNIVKFIEGKKTKKHFYIVTEYCNGGELSEALEKYKLKYGKPFSEEIVQYLMKQIIDAFNYLHSQGIIHRDIKLENILLQYETEEDKKNLNIMKAIPKIIDFGLSIKPLNGEAKTIVGSPLNMAPILLSKYTNPKIREAVYDYKVDIWSLGSICYEMLIGEFAFDSEDIDELVKKIEKGDYTVPLSLSEEAVSFLNAMLQYSPKNRLACAQLSKSRFLQQNINTFHKIQIDKFSDRIINGNELVINIKTNNLFCSIFNKVYDNLIVGSNSKHINQKFDVEQNYVFSAGIFYKN
jgi:serine/threonine protein kinase